MIEEILQFERVTAAKAVVSAAPDKLQHELAEEIKNMMRRASADRAKTKARRAIPRSTVRTLADLSGQ